MWNGRLLFCVICNSKYRSFSKSGNAAFSTPNCWYSVDVFLIILSIMETWRILQFLSLFFFRSIAVFCFSYPCKTGHLHYVIFPPILRFSNWSFSKPRTRFLNFLFRPFSGLAHGMPNAFSFKAWYVFLYIYYCDCFLIGGFTAYRDNMLKWPKY